MPSNAGRAPAERAARFAPPAERGQEGQQHGSREHGGDVGQLHGGEADAPSTTIAGRLAREAAVEEPKEEEGVEGMAEGGGHGAQAELDEGGGPATRRPAAAPGRDAEARGEEGEHRDRHRRKQRAGRLSRVTVASRRPRQGSEQGVQREAIGEPDVDAGEAAEPQARGGAHQGVRGAGRLSRRVEDGLGLEPEVRDPPPAPPPPGGRAP